MLQFFGQFHPAIVHFPVALLMVAAVLEVCFLFSRKVGMQQAAVWNLHLGAAGAVVAAAMGWALAETMSVEPELRSTLLWHRWLGVGTAAFGTVAVVAWHVQRRVPSRGFLLLYRLVLILGAAAVALAGHTGGTLVYGLDYYTWSLR